MRCGPIRWYSSSNVSPLSTVLMVIRRSNPSTACEVVIASWSLSGTVLTLIRFFRTCSTVPNSFILSAYRFRSNRTGHDTPIEVFSAGSHARGLFLPPFLPAMGRILTEQVQAGHDRVDDLVRARRASGNIDINRDDAVNAVHHMVQAMEYSS